jgi:tRNA pseudouridine65 synthase
MLQFDILYRDPDCIAIHKPQGVLVHYSRSAGREGPCVVPALRQQLGRIVFPVHRLDRPTSGVLLLALTVEATRRLSHQFEQRLVTKNYMALVRGHCDDSGCIDRPLKPPRDRWNRSEQSQPQAALTRFTTLARSELPFPVGRYETSRYSLLSLSPASGRRHQIRRHLKHISHPVIGDTTHGDRDHNRFFASQFGIQRLLLVANQLIFQQPFSGQTITVQSTSGSEFERAVTAAGCRPPAAPVLD